jgi:valyl-tRNA synthetase
MIDNMKKYIQLFEARMPDVKYEQKTKEVIAYLQSYRSQTYTNLAKKVERLTQLEFEVKKLKEEVKVEARENVAEIFDASDAIHTRVVETVSFILTLSKDPAVTVTPKYKDILEELSKHLTPELIVIMEQLKKELITETRKQPSITVKPRLSESYGDADAFLAHVNRWASGFDRKLDALKKMV